MEGRDVESRVGRGLYGVDQGSPRVVEGVWTCMLLEMIGESWRDREIPKGCVPLGIYRVEETKGFIDGMGTVRLHRANGHNGSIQDHVV